jgi:hypothetical protein
MSFSLTEIGKYDVGARAGGGDHRTPGINGSAVSPCLNNFEKVLDRAHTRNFVKDGTKHCKQQEHANPLKYQPHFVLSP